jgi:hypothetical protein
MDRVAIVAWCWFVLWTGLGTAIGGLFGTPGTEAISRFSFGLLATFAWPWIMPEGINDWMDDLPT